jgi:hypothetical protein
MSNRNYHPVKGSLSPGLVLIQGFLSIKADASVDTTLTYCRQGTFTKDSGTGIYLLTLEDSFYGKVYATLTPLKATAGDTQWELVSAPGLNGTTGKVITLRHVKTSDGTAVAPGAVCGVVVDIRAIDSSL